MLSTGLFMLAGDTQLLKLTHDEARALMKRPDDERQNRSSLSPAAPSASVWTKWR